MKAVHTDIAILGAGPVGLMCAYLAQLCGIKTITIDKSSGPLQVGRADALNARKLQYLETIGLFSEVYPLGKTCNTSSIWANGGFVSRQSSWWEELQGCLHKHFLMIGQSYIEKILDQKLSKMAAAVLRSTTVEDIQITADNCVTRLSNGDSIHSKYVIGADGARSFVRQHFKVPFEITKPELIWAVIDGVVATDFPKVPEIIVFQAETSDVAWIPREGDLDRFYIRMDKKEFTVEEVIAKINHAMRPHTLSFKDIVWFSQFSVKESVAETFQPHERVFLAGDACHIHSVNGGQGLNTGLADAFNLIWKLGMVLNHNAPKSLLKTYETERKPVALSVIESSGQLVRSTKYSVNGTHALDYIRIVQERAGNITGMGIRYGGEGLPGSRLFDFEIYLADEATRLYSLLQYPKFTLLLFTDDEVAVTPNETTRVIQIRSCKTKDCYWTPDRTYADQAVLVRPDSFIESVVPIESVRSI